MSGAGLRAALAGDLVALGEGVLALEGVVG
jgi:hypothetical protein